MDQPYIDARGVWPVYVRGLLAIPLVGKKRDITVEDAEAVLDVIAR